MAEHTSDQLITPEPLPPPLSLHDESPAPALQAARSSRNAIYIAAAVGAVILLAACLLTTALGDWGGSDALSESDVRRIVDEAVGTQIAAAGFGGSAGQALSGDEIRQMVDSAVGTQVAGLQPTATPIPPTPTVIPRGVAEDDDAFLGPDEAPVVIVEFSDFQCGYCGRWFEETLPRIRDAYPQDVKIVYRDFPIFGEESVRAAMATECAEEQDKYWQMHDRLFERTINNEQDPLSEETLVSYAGELGLDTAGFSECLSSQRYFDEIVADFQAAQGYGLRGTPGFVINGVVYAIGAQPFEVFKDIIDSELARVGSGS